VACWEKKRKAAVGAKFHFGAPVTGNAEKGWGLGRGLCSPPQVRKFCKT